MNKKYLKSLIDGVSAIEVQNETQQIAKYELIEYVEELQDKIDKAIEYIESNPNVFYDEYLIDVETLLENEGKDEFVGEIKFISKLLEILKGGKNE